MVLTQSGIRTCGTAGSPIPVHAVVSRRPPRQFTDHAIMRRFRSGKPWATYAKTGRASGQCRWTLRSTGFSPRFAAALGVRIPFRNSRRIWPRVPVTKHSEPRYQRRMGPSGARLRLSPSHASSMTRCKTLNSIHISVFSPSRETSCPWWLQNGQATRRPGARHRTAPHRSRACLAAPVRPGRPLSRLTHCGPNS